VIRATSRHARGSSARRDQATADRSAAVVTTARRSSRIDNVNIPRTAKRQEAKPTIKAATDIPALLRNRETGNWKAESLISGNLPLGCTACARLLPNRLDS